MDLGFALPRSASGLDQSGTGSGHLTQRPNVSASSSLNDGNYLQSSASTQSSSAQGLGSSLPVAGASSQVVPTIMQPSNAMPPTGSATQTVSRYQLSNGLVVSGATRQGGGQDKINKHNNSERPDHPFTGYGNFRSLFQDGAEANNYLSLGSWAVPPGGTPVTLAAVRRDVQRIFDAMADLDHYRDTSAGRQQRQLIYGKTYTAVHLEARAWEVVNETIELHNRGFCDLPFWMDRTQMTGSNSADRAADRALTYAERIEELCQTLSDWKTICLDVLHGQARQVVPAPRCLRCVRGKNQRHNNKAPAAASSSATNAVQSSTHPSTATLKFASTPSQSAVNAATAGQLNHGATGRNRHLSGDMVTPSTGGLDSPNALVAAQHGMGLPRYGAGYGGYRPDTSYGNTYSTGVYGIGQQARGSAQYPAGSMLATSGGSFYTTNPQSVDQYRMESDRCPENYMGDTFNEPVYTPSAYGYTGPAFRSSAEHLNPSINSAPFAMGPPGRPAQSMAPVNYYDNAQSHAGAFGSAPPPHLPAPSLAAVYKRKHAAPKHINDNEEFSNVGGDSDQFFHKKMKGTQTNGGQ